MHEVQHHDHSRRQWETRAYRTALTGIALEAWEAVAAACGSVAQARVGALHAVVGIVQGLNFVHPRWTTRTNPCSKPSSRQEQQCEQPCIHDDWVLHQQCRWGMAFTVRAVRSSKGIVACTSVACGACAMLGTCIGAGISKHLSWCKEEEAADSGHHHQYNSFSCCGSPPRRAQWRSTTTLLSRRRCHSDTEAQARAAHAPA